MRTKLLLLTFIFVCSSGSTQASLPALESQQLAALEKLEHFALTGDTSGVQSVMQNMNERFGPYTSREFNIAIDACIQRALKTNNVSQLQQFYTVQGKWYQFNNDVSHAVEQYSKVVSLLKSNNRENETIWILIDIGNLFYSVDNFNDAVLFYNKAQALCDKTKDRYALSVINLNLGLVEAARNEYPSAVSYLKKCIALREGTKENAFKSHTFIKLSEIYSLMNQMDSVFYYIRSAELLYYAEGTNVGILQDMPALIGLAYYKYYEGTGDARLAEMNLTKARTFIKSKGLKARLYDSYITEAEISSRFGNHQKVIDSLSPLMNELQVSRFTSMYKQALHLLAIAHHETENYSTSKELYEKFIAIEEKAHANMSISNSAVTGLLDTQAKAKENAAAAVVPVGNKSGKGLQYFLGSALLISVIMLLIQRKKLKYQRARVSELKRTLNRQNEEFSQKLTSRLKNEN